MRIVHRHLLSYAMLALALSLPATALAQSSVTGINTLSSTLPIGAGGNVAMTVLPSGNVEIGSALLPAQQLQVGNADNNFALFSFNNSVVPAPAFGLLVGFNGTIGQGEADFWNGYPSAVRSFDFRQLTGSSTYNTLMTIMSSGNVGIGTAAPAAALDVAGAVRATGTTTVSGTVYSTVENQPCTPEGAIAYDMTNHQPIYCTQSGTWALLNPDAAFMNRTWHSFSPGGTRVTGTTYTNNNSYPIEVAITVQNIANCTGGLVINGSEEIEQTGTIFNTGAYQSVCSGPLYATVPPGATYKEVAAGATISWWELY